MPDRDNLSKTLKKPWGGAVKAAKQGPEVLAQFLAAITTQVIADVTKPQLLFELSKQLQKINELPKPAQATAIVELPKGAETVRENLIAIKAAQRIHVEILLSSEKLNASQVKSKFFEAFCLEIPKAMCLGILVVKVPEIFLNSDKALNQQRICEEKLASLLSRTAQELEANPEKPKITKIKKPPSKPKKSQQELVGSKPKMNLENI